MLSPSTVAPPARSATAPWAELPVWPVFLLFAGYPVWWALGLGSFAVLISGVVMLILLVLRGRVELPLGFAVFLMFLLWTLASASQLDSHQLIGFVVRFGNLFGCAVLCLYIYNARPRLTTRLVLVALACFLAFAVFGGYLGVLLPNGSLSTPVEKVLPGSIASNSYVSALVHPAFAEIQHPYGSPVSFARPSAPFPYTNSWGCNVALLIPLALAALPHLRTHKGRVVVVAVLAAGAVPAGATLNRGLYIGLIIALAYVAIRLAARGRIVPLGVLLGAATVAYAIAVVTGFTAQLSQRLQYSESNAGRSAIYAESFQGALQSPILGHGAPGKSDTVDVAVGSQGQIWNLMYSYGFIGLGLFVLFFLVATWAGRRALAPGSLWLNATLVVAIVSFIYYGFDGPQLAVAVAAAALTIRERDHGVVVDPRDIEADDIDDADSDYDDGYAGPARDERPVSAGVG